MIHFYHFSLSNVTTVPIFAVLEANLLANFPVLQVSFELGLPH